MIIFHHFSMVNKAERKKWFACHHSTLGLRVGSIGQDFFKVSLVPRALLLFYISLVVGKRSFNAIRGYDLTSEPQTLEALQNAFILICCCKIYLHERANVLEAAIFM